MSVADALPDDVPTWIVVRVRDGAVHHRTFYNETDAGCFAETLAGSSNAAPFVDSWIVMKSEQREKVPMKLQAKLGGAVAAIKRRTRVIRVGDSARNKSTNELGVVVSICEWLHGRKRYGFVAGKNIDHLRAWFLATQDLGVTPESESTEPPFKILWLDESDLL